MKLSKEEIKLIEERRKSNIITDHTPISKDAPPVVSESPTTVGADTLEDKVKKIIGKEDKQTEENYACVRCGFDKVQRIDKACSSCNYELDWTGIP